MKETEIELNQIPNPKTRKNIPVNIGFLVYAYGPVSTNFGGGFNGTGVPFALKKFRFDQKIKNKPIKINGSEIILFQSAGNKFGNWSQTPIL